MNRDSSVTERDCSVTLHDSVTQLEFLRSFLKNFVDRI
jgi:hypothetical protein